MYEKPTIEKDARLNLQRLTRIHLFSNCEFDSAHGDITYVVIFSLVAFFILLIACINFMNLATARSGNRAKEIGMRKVAGAYKTDIIKQFFGESILFSFISLVFALIIVWLLLPAFSDLAAKEISMDISGNLLVLLGLLCIALMTGIISGSYPALFLSAFQPVNVLKGTLKSGSKGSTFRKILVVIQFSLTILLIICTTFVYSQLKCTHIWILFFKQPVAPGGAKSGRRDLNAGGFYKGIEYCFASFKRIHQMGARVQYRRLSRSLLCHEKMAAKLRLLDKYCDLAILTVSNTGIRNRFMCG